MPTIRDVARRAGVGLGTVSRFLNGGSISEEKKARIMVAIRELDYQLNEVARSLSTGRSKSVGLIIPDLLNPFYPALIHGVEEVCKAAGVMVILAHSAEDKARVPELVRDVTQRGVDAIICAAGPVYPPAVSVPLVMVDRVEGSVPFDSVATDHEQGGRSAAEHLIARGHTRVMFLSGPEDNAGVQGRWKGFAAAMRDRGLTPERLVGERLEFLQGYVLAATYFQPLRSQPGARATAVFASNDLMALGVIRAVTEAGLRVPTDVSVIGFDGIDAGDYVTPPLTSVAQPTLELGRVAAELALERAYGGYAGPVRSVRLRPQLTIRGSG